MLQGSRDARGDEKGQKKRRMGFDENYDQDRGKSHQLLVLQSWIWVRITHPRVNRSININQIDYRMQQIVDQKVRSIILTSGTLSPLKPLISELGIPIEVQLENPHIVTGRQVCVGVLSNGPDGTPLNSSYNTR